jgi:hypothetical protein
MKKLTGLFLGSIILFVVSLGIFLASSAIAADAKLVKIQPVGEGKLVGFYLDPTVLTIEKNTIVVWLSGVQGEDIQVLFMEGKTCRDVTANPKEFSLDKAKGCYVTSFMSFVETSSLQFVDSGTYRYYVATASGNIKAKGTIVVR